MNNNYLILRVTWVKYKHIKFQINIDNAHVVNEL